LDNNDYRSALEELLFELRKKSTEAEVDIRRVISRGTTRDTAKDDRKQSATLPLTSREAYFLAVRLVLCLVDPILMQDRVSRILEPNGNISPEIEWHSDYVSDDLLTQDLYEPLKVPPFDDGTKNLLHQLSETVEKIRAELEKQGD